jgi:hypothetical protein
MKKSFLHNYRKRNKNTLNKKNYYTLTIELMIKNREPWQRLLHLPILLGNKNSLKEILIKQLDKYSILPFSQQI